jgi:predicted lipid-binding transport protein (Tim44 family)
MDRTATEPSRPGTTNPGAATAGAASMARPGGMFGGGMMGAVMGGLIGVGLGGLLFGHGMFGGISGLGGMLGLLLQIGLVVLLARFALRWFRNRNQPAMAGGPNPGMSGMNRAAAPGPFARQADSRMSMGGGSAVATTPVQLSEADFNAFEQLLKGVNDAWSRRDEAALGRLTTPEMAGYFAGDLRDLAARNWHNQTSDVRLEQGDLSEAWREGGTEYATVAMRFSLIDITRDASGAVVEGDTQKRQTTAELWTFARQGGGAWRVSAIQQAG